MLFEVDIEDINSPLDLTLDIVKSYMRIDHNLDDLELQIYIKSAIAYIKGYANIEEFDDEVELVMPTLILVTHFYENKTALMPTNNKLDSIFNNLICMNKRGIL